MNSSNVLDWSLRMWYLWLVQWLNWLVVWSSIKHDLTPDILAIDADQPMAIALFLDRNFSSYSVHA